MNEQEIKAIREHFMATRKITRTEKQVLHEIEEATKALEFANRKLTEWVGEAQGWQLAQRATEITQLEGKLQGLEFALAWLRREGLNILTMLPEGEN